MNNAKMLVDRGMKVLDSLQEGWVARIDVENLNHPTQVLEMVFGSYFIGASHLRYPPMDFGFDNGIAPNEALVPAWREAIKDRHQPQTSLFG